MSPARGSTTVPGQIVITSGAQQGISAAAACWLRPGDTVVVEDPCYPGAIAAFAQAGARLVGVPVDADGVRLDALSEAVAARPALVFLQPTVQSPTGSVLPLVRRRGVAELVRRYRVPLLEDLALADLSWSPSPAPVSARARRVGGRRRLVEQGPVGWAPARVRAGPGAAGPAFARVKATNDLGTSAVSQLLAERLLSGSPDVWRTRSVEVRRRYDVLAALLADRLAEWHWTEPAGGLSIWVSLGGVDAERFARVALRHGVAVASATALSVSGGHADRIRVSFAAPPDVLRQAVERLRTAWEAVRS